MVELFLLFFLLQCSVLRVGYLESRPSNFIGLIVSLGHAYPRCQNAARSVLGFDNTSATHPQAQQIIDVTRQ